MPLYIALLRGINVGGSNSLPMKDLVPMLENSGAQNIRTYIQSGNAVFEHPDEDMTRLSERIVLGIGKHRGFTPQVLLLSQAEFVQAITENPFTQHISEGSALHLGFLTETPENVDMEKLLRLKSESEKFKLVNRVFYLYAPEGVGRSKLAAGAEKVLGVVMTDRNWKTVCKIRDLVENFQGESAGRT